MMAYSTHLHNHMKHTERSLGMAPAGLVWIDEQVEGLVVEGRGGLGCLCLGLEQWGCWGIPYDLKLQENGHTVYHFCSGIQGAF